MAGDKVWNSNFAESDALVASKDSLDAGAAMHALAQRLFGICRSLTGDGTRKTLKILSEHLPRMTVHELPSGTKAFDWVVPDEWNISAARLVGPDGVTIADFNDNNLHVVGYSEPVNSALELEDLQKHLHSLPELPDAIPYVTSYYFRYWGFCLSDRVRQTLPPGSYRAIIDSSLAPGSLTYGELLIPGETKSEIFLSTYVCHPSMANNELSGPVVTTWLAKWISSASRYYSYRIIFIPETIGSICYCSRNLDEMKQRTVAGFNISCVGDDREHSYLPSRSGTSLADRAALHVLGHVAPGYRRYSFLDRGSDERQYCAPGIDLPVASVMRSKYGEYPEYHTSLDDLTLVTSAGLAGGYEALRKCIETIEANDVWRVTVLGEPQLGKRGLYPNTSERGAHAKVKAMMDLIAYADGTRDLISIAEAIGVPVWELAPLCEKLAAHSLIERVAPPVDIATA